MTEASADVLFDGPDLRARSVGPVAVMAWHATPRRATIEAVAPRVRSHREAHPHGVALAMTVRGAPPDDEARTALREMVRSVERSMLGVGVVVGFVGLRGTIVRTAINTAVRALRLPFDVKVLESAGLVARHLEGLFVGAKLDAPRAADIERAIEELARPR